MGWSKRGTAELRETEEEKREKERFFSCIAQDPQRLVRLAKSLRLNVLIAEAVVRCKAYTPRIPTVRKKR